MTNKAHKINCTMCETITLVEVVNDDEQPENCPMCGHPIDIFNHDDEWDEWDG